MEAKKRYPIDSRKYTTIVVPRETRDALTALKGEFDNVGMGKVIDKLIEEHSNEQSRK